MKGVKIYSHVISISPAPPWWTKAPSRAIFKKSSLYFKYWTTKSTSDNCNNASQQNLVKAKVCLAQMTYEEKLVKKSKNNPKALYLIILLVELNYLLMIPKFIQPLRTSLTPSIYKRTYTWSMNGPTNGSYPDKCKLLQLGNFSPTTYYLRSPNECSRSKN